MKNFSALTRLVIMSNEMITYGGGLVVLFLLELLYFRIADKCNIIDKPNERSSHSTIVLRGGGIIFAISILVWMALQMVHGEWFMVKDYLPFIVGLVLICGVSFIDDIHSLPDSLRMIVQIFSILLMFWSINLGLGVTVQGSWLLQVVIAAIALFFCVGATNIINFMDGINGITAGYSLAMLVPLALVNGSGLASPTVDATRQCSSELGTALAAPTVQGVQEFIEPSYLIVAIIGVMVFSIFNFRPKGKAKCFAGDVGSIGIAFIILFALGRLMLVTKDVTYIVFFLIYGVDGTLTIIHRIMLHEHLGEAHRKHAYQLMANELKMSHVVVSLLYMVMQLAVSLGFIYLCPNTILAHWIYFIAAAIVFAVAYVLFMKKYYPLHEAYLASLKKQ